MQIEKEEVKLLLFADNTILYLKDLKDFTNKNSLRSDNLFQLDSRMQNPHPKLSSFSHTNNE
jgi:hypothetical protein